MSPTLATQGGETHLIRKPTKRTQDGQLSQQVHATISRWLLSLQNFGDTVYSPLFFHEIIEIELVLPLMAAILIFSRTESNLGMSIKST